MFTDNYESSFRFSVLEKRLTQENRFQDSRTAFGVTVKIHILTLQWPNHFGYPIRPEGSQSLSLIFFLNLSLEVWTELGKKAHDKDHALSGGTSLVQVWCSQLK